MKTYLLIRHAQCKSSFMILNISGICRVLMCLLLSVHMVNAQNCDKKESIYFGTNEASIAETENPKLEKLCKAFAQKTDTFLLEIRAYSDSIASAEYNYKLADKRLKSIVSYLKKHSSAHLEIKGDVRGEALPLGSNGTEEGRAKNRRVDLVYFKLRGNKVTIKGKGGSEIDMNKNYFGSCGICGSNPKITEVFTNEEAERQGVSLTTTDGEQLITGGMLSMELSCADRKVWPCSDVYIRIPADKFDEELEIWKVEKPNTSGQIRWYRDEKGDLEYDAKNKVYIMKVNYCPGGRGMSSGINLDKPRIVASAPRIIDSVGLIAVPELVRSRSTSNARALYAGRIYGNGAMASDMWRFRYRGGKGSVFFQDSGMAKNKIGYRFSGVIDRFEANCDTAKCRTEKLCWCFEVPIEKYTKVIYFQKKKNYRLKLPLGYRQYAVRLYIPGADTLLDVKALKGLGRKSGFKEPLPETHVVMFNKKHDPKNKRDFDAEVYLGDIKVKYKHNYYKAKISRKQLRRAIASSSGS